MRRLPAIAAVALAFLGPIALLNAQGKKAPTDPALLRIGNGGQVLHSPNVTAVFWGPEWSDPAFAGDIITGLDTLLSGYSGSDYAKIATEDDDRGGAVSPFARTLAASWIRRHRQLQAASRVRRPLPKPAR